jgi:hypothetical protein
MSLVIRFNYFYKDYENNKKFGSKLFSNPFRLSHERINKYIEESLIFGKYFYPDQVGIKKFKFHRYICDYSWYEFESIEPFEDKNIDIDDLMEHLDASINGFLFDLGRMFY